MDSSSNEFGPVSYITDCRDENTKGRLKARVSTLFPGRNVVFVGVKDDVEAAINLVDLIDAYEGQPGIILANVARREGAERKQKWENGTPFGRVKLDNIELFTTIDGYMLSLLEKVLDKKVTVDIYDIPATVPHMQLDEVTQKRIINTQFRSFDYLPRLAQQLVLGRDLPVTEQWSDVPEMPNMVCWVDSFGNLKTNVIPEAVGFEVGKKLVFRVSNNKQLLLPCYERLKDIPDGVAALTIGSSGHGTHRFLEIMQQGKSAAYHLGIGSGTKIDFLE